jgi:hypothetical protein
MFSSVPTGTSYCTVCHMLASRRWYIDAPKSCDLNDRRKTHFHLVALLLALSFGFELHCIGRPLPLQYSTSFVYAQWHPTMVTEEAVTPLTEQDRTMVMEVLLLLPTRRAMVDCDDEIQLQIQLQPRFLPPRVPHPVW